MYSKSKIPKPTSSAKGDEAKKSKSKQSASAKKSSSTAPKLQPAAQGAHPAKATASASRPPKTGNYAKIQSKVAQLIHGKKNSDKKAKPSRIPVPVHRIQHAPVQAVVGGRQANAEEAKASRNTLKQTQSEGDSQNQQPASRTERDAQCRGLPVATTQEVSTARSNFASRTAT